MSSVCAGGRDNNDEAVSGVYAGMHTEVQTWALHSDNTAVDSVCA